MAHSIINSLHVFETKYKNKKNCQQIFVRNLTFKLVLVTNYANLKVLIPSSSAVHSEFAVEKPAAVEIISEQALANIRNMKNIVVGVSTGDVCSQSHPKGSINVNTVVLMNLSISAREDSMSALWYFAAPSHCLIILGINKIACHP